MSIVLYSGNKVVDFSASGGGPLDENLRHHVVSLLRARGQQRALELFQRWPWERRNGVNHFGDEFSVLVAAMAVQEYEDTRRFSSAEVERAAFRQIAETISEIGPYVRFIATELAPAAGPESADPRRLSEMEIQKLVNRYIGVSGGYLGDFSYRTHREFYLDLDLDIRPDEIPGTTRERFIAILSRADAAVQATILRGVLEKYPVGSSPLRTQGRFDEFSGWVRRLSSGPGVALEPLRVTSAVVERALSDAEQLLKSNGATSGVDRVHTALHGYLLQACRNAGLRVEGDPSLTELFKTLRSDHPKLREMGARPADVRKLSGAMATIIDVLNPLRSRASLAHPNAELLPEAEALLVINCVRSLLGYLDAKLATG